MVLQVQFRRLFRVVLHWGCGPSRQSWTHCGLPHKITELHYQKSVPLAQPYYANSILVRVRPLLSPDFNSSIGVHSPVPHLSQLRLFKSPGELKLMRKAGELAAKAFRHAMAATSPGVNEAVLESVFEQSVKSEGAQWMSFPPVVAGGNRATCLHYITNNRSLKWVDSFVVHCTCVGLVWCWDWCEYMLNTVLSRAGELVLMDAGCEYHGYVSDVTRTWPVGGQFTSVQKDLYEVVRMAKKEAIKVCHNRRVQHLCCWLAHWTSCKVKWSSLIDRVSLLTSINSAFPFGQLNFATSLVSQLALWPYSRCVLPFTPLFRWCARVCPFILMHVDV